MITFDEYYIRYSVCPECGQTLDCGPNVLVSLTDPVYPTPEANAILTRICVACCYIQLKQGQQPVTYQLDGPGALYDNKTGVLIRAFENYRELCIHYDDQVVKKINDLLESIKRNTP